MPDRARLDDVRAYIRSVEEELEATRVKILLNGTESGQFAQVDPRLCARSILWLGHLWALNRGGVRSQMSLDEFIAAQTAFFFAALRPAA